MGYSAVSLSDKVGTLLVVPNAFLKLHMSNIGFSEDLCLFVPCLPAFFDLLISLSQWSKGLMTLL